MSEQDGIICAYVFDGKGGARDLSTWDDVLAAQARQEFVWTHLQLENERARAWLTGAAGLKPAVASALLNDEPRPRCDVHDTGLIVCLRGVNLNPGADPEDMVSVRLWLEERRAITVRRRTLMAINDIRADIARGAGVKTAGAFLADLAGKLVARMGPVIADLDDRVDEIEDVLLTGPSREIRTRLGAIRRQAIALRRYIAPQREAMAQTMMLSVPWIVHPERDRLREVGDRITRYVEDLDSVRDRAAVMQEEVADRISDQMNRNMYLLSVVAVVFLPLGFLTGLLGVNVGGIPGTNDSWAFLIVCGLLIAVGAAEILYFRHRKWF